MMSVGLLGASPKRRREADPSDGAGGQRAVGPTTGKCGLLFEETINPVLRVAFDQPLRRALRDWPGECLLRVRRGRSKGEVVVVIQARDEAPPLPLYLPTAATLQEEEIYRIVTNVLEGLAPLPL